jgi:hypothetical protein
VGPARDPYPLVEPDSGLSADSHAPVASGSRARRPPPRPILRQPPSRADPTTPNPSQLRRRYANPSRAAAGRLCQSASSPPSRRQEDPQELRVEVPVQPVDVVLPGFAHACSPEVPPPRPSAPPRCAPPPPRHRQSCCPGSLALVARFALVLPTRAIEPCGSILAMLARSTAGRHRVLRGRRRPPSDLDQAVQIDPMSGSNLLVPVNPPNCTHQRSEPPDLEPADQIRSPALIAPFCSKAPGFF